MRVPSLFLLFFISFHAYSLAKEAIVLPLNDWASQRLLSKIVGDKIEQLGYPVEYLVISSINQMGALRKGLVHIQVEIWQTYDDGTFAQAVKAGYIEDLGLHSALGREDWWYPEYVEQLCPGLPAWQALKKCAEIFSGDSQSSKGVYYTGPWNYRDAALIRALGMNFTIERLGNAEQLWQKLRQAEKAKQAIVLLNWSPNWIDVRIKGHFIEFPEFEKACEQDASWGVNKEMYFDCGNPKVTYIKKAAWPGLKKRWPCVYQLLKKVNFTTEMIAEASALNGADKKTEQQAITAWLTKFSDQSQDWLSFTCPKNLLDNSP
ncbi:glycine/betaine ABC transporter substrate-binding protein [Colwellia sp. MT41]|uniref:ABC transporter n=1 Tax=Colwellia marinimaniae TaxID=1513592 RepID=A0ABQ0MUV3_9GAMM|nr:MULTISPECIES: ABC transporter substrate-binding protein [Colwellia]ALO34224.1 glycine/betaine ABC transporter substrate-binding protein [Colwellia sp. MT41]GAW96143.1 ABC transporter [Colwellia marinimaniae]